MPENDDQIELKTGVRDAAVARAAQHTVQIQYNDFGTPAAIGSGIILEVGSSLFVVTAAHVLDDATGLGALTATGGLGKSDSIELKNRPAILAGDPQDICLIGLDLEEKKNWRKLRPLHLGDLGVGDDQRPENWYVMLGYPGQTFSPDPDARIIRSQGFVYSSHAASDPEVLKRLDSGINVSVEWYPDANRGDWYPDDFVTPKGMSGCGIWRVPRVNIPANLSAIRPDLVGIATHALTDHKVFVGTRIEHVLAVISGRFPNLANAINLSLPFSMRVK